jgi:hypothetical protein
MWIILTDKELVAVKVDAMVCNHKGLVGSSYVPIIRALIAQRFMRESIREWERALDGGGNK